MTRERERIRRELAEALFRQVTPGVLAAGAAAGLALFCALQRVFTPRPAVWVWGAAHLAMVLSFTAGDALYRRRTAGRHDAVAWSRWLNAALLGSAAMWTVALPLFFDGSNPTSTAFHVMFYAGTSMITLVGLSPAFAGYASYAVVTGVTMAALLWRSGTDVHRIMSLAECLGVMISLVGAWRLRQLLVNAAELRFQNEDLAERLRVEKERAEEASAAKTRFLAAASHDLRQPLQALCLFAELLESRPDDPQRHAWITGLSASSRALEGLLNALLDVSRIEAGRLEPRSGHFPLGPVFDALRLEWQGQAERKGLLLTVRPATHVVEADPELLGRVLRNLLSNALRYTEAGEILLEARDGAAGRVTLSVADTGRGIPPAEQERVFEEFHQLGNPHRDRELGLGLGLTIVRGICRALGWRLALTSQPVRERGTEVTVGVPLGDAARIDPKVEPAVAPGALSGRRVLVIDDEKDIRVGLAALLTSWSCEAVCAGSLREAQALVDSAGLPDAIVCDDRLPESMTGPLALETLEKRFGARLPAVFVTGDTSPERIRAMKETGRALLFKPVMPGKLRAALTALLAADGT